MYSHTNWQVWQKVLNTKILCNYQDMVSLSAKCLKWIPSIVYFPWKNFNLGLQRISIKILKFIAMHSMWLIWIFIGAVGHNISFKTCSNYVVGCPLDLHEVPLPALENTPVRAEQTHLHRFTLYVDTRATTAHAWAIKHPLDEVEGQTQNLALWCIQIRAQWQCTVLRVFWVSCRIANPTAATESPLWMPSQWHQFSVILVRFYYFISILKMTVAWSGQQYNRAPQCYVSLIPKGWSVIIMMCVHYCM